MKRALAPLRERGFRPLLASYTLNDIGDAIGIVALALLVYDETHDPIATALLFVGARFIPAILAPLLTARVDLLPIRRVLPAMYGLGAGIFLLLALLVAAGTRSLAVVLPLAAIDGMIFLTGRSLTRGATAALLKGSGLLREGNGLLNVGFALGSVGGSAAGGAIVASGGVETALLVDAGSFAVAAIILGLGRGLPFASSEREHRTVTRLREGLRYARSSRVVRLLLTGEAFALFFFTLIVPIEVVYAKETLASGDAGYGVLLASWGGGIVLGSLCFMVLKSRSGTMLVLGSTLAVGVSYIGLALVDDLTPACAISILGGIGNGIQWISVMTLLQEAVEDEMQARVAGLLESVGAAVPGVGFLAGGALTALTSPPTAYAIAGGGVLGVVLIGSLVRGLATASLRRSGAADSGRVTPG